MLRKLLKYEIKATARIFLPLYAVLLSVALINRLISPFSPLKMPAPKMITMIIYIAILVGIFVVTFVMMLQRFYKNLLSEEGYLMFTLPTLPWKLIVSKLLIAILWTVASVIAAFISIFILFVDLKGISSLLTDLSFLAGKLYASFGLSAYLFLAENLLAFLMYLTASILIFYAAMAIGHIFNRHKILASIGSLIGLNIITQLILVLSVHYLPFDILFGILDSPHHELTIHLSIWLTILVAGIIAAGYFIITNYILSHHLNLE